MTHRESSSLSVMHTRTRSGSRIFQRFLKPYEKKGKLKIWADPYMRWATRGAARSRRRWPATRVGAVLMTQDLVAFRFHS